MRSPILALAVAVLLPTSVMMPVPVLADPPSHAPAWGRRAKEQAAAPWYADRYYRSGEAYRPRVLGVDDRIYRGRDGRYYCKRDDGTTGLIVGGIAGGVLGNVIAPGGSKTLGTILGAAGGALIGRAIDRDEVVCR